MKHRALITYSGQGGTAAGWANAGWDVTCVDSDPKMLTRCPFPSIQADAIDYIGNEGHRFSAIEGGPVCKAYSKTARIHNAGHPAQIPATREAMVATGKPYVIENVEEALPELKDPIILCGQVFGLQTYRHRLFESNVMLEQPRPNPGQMPNPDTCGFEHHYPLAKMGRPVPDGSFYHAVGHFSGVGFIRADMGVPWMNRDGINQCIPPVMAQYVAAQVLAYVLEMAA